MARRPGPGRPAARTSLTDRVLTVRNRLLRSGRFQRWAAAFPATRPIAHRQARTLFDLCAGFVYSQVLAACVRLRVFELLADGSLTLDALCEALALSPESTARLLDAAVSLKLLARRGQRRYALGTLGAVLTANPAIAAMIRHHALLYDDLRDPVALLRGDLREARLARYWAYASSASPAALNPDQVAAYTSLMSDSQALIADEVLDAYPLRRHKCLLDVGGGDGTFLIAAAARAPALRLLLFDLPPVAQLAQARFAASGLAHRAEAIGGDFLRDRLPRGADAVSLLRVLHDHDDAGALAILRSIRRALSPEGVLLVAEPMSGTRGAEPMGDAYFGFYLLAMGRGRPRSASTLKRLLQMAGFGAIRSISTRLPLQARLILAYPT